MDIWLMIEIHTIIYQQAAVAVTIHTNERLFSRHLPCLAFSLLFFLIASPCSMHFSSAGNPGTRPSQDPPTVGSAGKAPHSLGVAVSPPVPYAACVLTASGQWRSEPGAKNEACRLIDQILIPHDLQQSQPTKTSFILMWHGPRVGSLKFTGQ